MALVWELHLLSEARTQGTNTQMVRNKLLDFMCEMKSLLNHESEELSEEAFVSICDLLIIFCSQLENDSPAVAPLVYKPNVALIQQLEAFILERVFIEDDESEGRV